MSDTFDLSSLFPGTAGAQLQRQFVGKWFLDNARTKSDPNGVWVEPIGELHNREDQAVWWDWVQREQVEIIDDATWKSLELLSPNGAVSAYSTGDGSTTFRAPSVGNDGGFIRAKGKAVTDPVILNIGFADKLAHHKHLTPTSASSGLGYLYNVAPFGSLVVGPMYTRKTVITSAVAPEDQYNGFMLTSDETYHESGETTPKGMWGKYFIYTGKDIPIYTDINQPKVVNRNLFINSDESVNQDNVTNWASVTARTGPGTGYGFDMTIKIDANTKTQIIEEGEFVPDTIHTMSWYVGNDRFSKQVTSPSSGHWESSDLHMPINAIRYKLEKGSLLTDWEPDGWQVNLSKCQRHYEKGYDTQETYGQANASVGQSVNFKVTKRSVPNVTVADAGSVWTKGDPSVINPIRLDSARIKQSKDSASGHYLHSISWVADARL
ncbi:hypothetical protein ACPV5U_08530 [Vibrio mediterranei]